MKMPATIAIMLLVILPLSMPVARAQSQDGAAEDDIPPQLQTDSQRQASRARRAAQAASAGAPEAVGSADGSAMQGDRTIADTLATAAAVDIVNAAAGAATNAIRRRGNGPYPVTTYPPANQNTNDTSLEPGDPADGRSP